MIHDSGLCFLFQSYLQLILSSGYSVLLSIVPKCWQSIHLDSSSLPSTLTSLIPMVDGRACTRNLWSSSFISYASLHERSSYIWVSQELYRDHHLLTSLQQSLIRLHHVELGCSGFDLVCHVLHLGVFNHDIRGIGTCLLIERERKHLRGGLHRDDSPIGCYLGLELTEVAIGPWSSLTLL